MHDNHCSTIYSLFEAQAEKYPNNTAVIFEDKGFSYADLNEKSNQLAHYLREMGVKAEVPVGLCMARSVDLLVAMLAILKAGGAYVPLDGAGPKERLSLILKDINAPILITDQHFKEKLKHYQDQLIVCGSELESITLTYPTCHLSQNITPRNLAYIIYTSGSTGTPKGVLVEHASVVNHTYWFSQYVGCRHGQRIDFSSNYTFDMAVTSSIVALMLGLTVVICSDEVKKNSSHYFNYLERYKINIIKLTPSYFKVLLHELKNNFYALEHLKSIILGGENLLVIDCIAWHNLYPDHVLFNEYGPTEATVAVTSHQIDYTTDMNMTGSVPIGKPGTNMACYILDTDHNPVPNGDIGELYIGGDCLARGYLNKPDLTQKSFIKNPLGSEDDRLYKTGDLCKLLPHGEIEYIDRTDNQVKIRGFRIELTEIERCLMGHPSILDAVVLTQQNAHHAKQIIAYCISNTGSAPLDIFHIQQYLNTKLPYYMIPSAFVRVDSFPLNENGKLDRHALPIPQFETNQHDAAPCTPLEKKLAAIWAEELGQKVIGIESDFFELGGDSLSAARVISSIASQLKREVNLHDFYGAGTISKLVPIVKASQRRKKPIRDRTIKLNAKPLFPLSDFQLLIWLCNNFEPGAQKINITIRKRLQGRLDKDALLLAFNMILKQHEVLAYRIFRLWPAQRVQQHLSVEIDEQCLTSLSLTKAESTLNASITALQYYHPWPKGKPLLMVRLFRLHDETDELQIAISHFVADYVSSEILLHDLSQFYLLCCHGHSNVKQLKVDMNHRTFLFDEKEYLKAHLNDDILFWQSYLKEACLFAFPENQLVNAVDLHSFSYSTYLELPDSALNKVQAFCASHCVSLGDGLMAASLLALSSCCDRELNEGNPIFISRVKSIRHNPKYDKTIGCFLRVEAIKVDLNKPHSMVSLATEIHQADRETSAHQQSLSLVKIASVSTFFKERKTIKNYLIRAFSYVYTKVFQKLQLHPQLLNSCGRLFLYERDNHFLININVQTNLIANQEKKKKTHLLGLKTKSITTYPYDLLKANNVFDVCFLRDENQNTAYVVVSAKLLPAFRHQVAQKIIEIINAEQWNDDPAKILTQTNSDLKCTLNTQE